MGERYLVLPWARENRSYEARAMGNLGGAVRRPSFRNLRKLRTDRAFVKFMKILRTLRGKKGKFNLGY